MANAKLTAVQAAIINGARNNSSDDERKQIKREVFSVVKAKFGIPESAKLKANTTGVDQPGYLVLHDKDGNAFQLGDNGQWNGVLVPKAPPVVAPASSLDGCGACTACDDVYDLDGFVVVYSDPDTRVFKHEAALA
jgi:hypothetical protein